MPGGEAAQQHPPADLLFPIAGCKAALGHRRQQLPGLLQQRRLRALVLAALTQCRPLAHDVASMACAPLPLLAHVCTGCPSGVPAQPDRPELAAAQPCTAVCRGVPHHLCGTCAGTGAKRSRSGAGLGNHLPASSAEGIPTPPRRSARRWVTVSALWVWQQHCVEGGKETSRELSAAG